MQKIIIVTGQDSEQEERVAERLTKLKGWKIVSASTTNTSFTQSVEPGLKDVLHVYFTTTILLEKKFGRTTKRR